MAVRQDPFSTYGPAPQKGRTSAEVRQQSEPAEPVCKWNKLLTTISTYLSKAEAFREAKLPECPTVRIKTIRDRLTSLLESFDESQSAAELDAATYQVDRDRAQLGRSHVHFGGSGRVGSQDSRDGGPRDGDDPSQFGQSAQAITVNAGGIHSQDGDEDEETDTEV